ncbi:hypothetical protein PCASD_23648 [Puccinia coronata f. sp. avenae]|uniref:Uncharacterized protein n=1 Tax=Puccinia coronata f. sp. avenae TaxID=200324 RepID=A0A2N5RXX6_9BASI|nr:hypothetical protein PCASD_23648 [Puccinia coronata f. sp. avenae]
MSIRTTSQMQAISLRCRPVHVGNADCQTTSFKTAPYASATTQPNNPTGRHNNRVYHPTTVEVISMAFSHSTQSLLLPDPPAPTLKFNPRPVQLPTTRLQRIDRPPTTTCNTASNEFITEDPATPPSDQRLPSLPDWHPLSKLMGHKPG